MEIGDSQLSPSLKGFVSHIQVSNKTIVEWKQSVFGYKPKPTVHLPWEKADHPVLHNTAFRTINQ